MNTGIGAHLPRREDHRLLTGRGCYADDLRAQGQVHGYALRADHAHARLKRIDVARAREAPGVLAVLTGEDYAADGLKGIPHGAMTVKPEDWKAPCFGRRDGSPAFSAPNIPIVRDKVHHTGEIVAFVVAETVQQARDAAERIDAQYEVLPAVIRGLDAIEPGAPRIWDELPDNIAFEGTNGDLAAAEAAFKKAACVVEEEFPFNRVANAQMEPRGCLAEYTRDGRYCLQAGSQGVHRLKTNAALVFSVDPSKVRVVTRDTGGGFGPRSHLYPEYVLALWASRRVGRPVKWTSERSEAFLSDYQARDLTIRAALALDGNGRFLALKETLYSNCGGNCVSYVPPVNGSRIATTVYRTPALGLTVYGILSNTLPSVNYRGAGRPQAMLAMERLVDLAAERTGIDRIELRRRNLIGPADFPFKTAGGLTYDCGEFERNMDRCMERVDWKGFPARREEAKRRGRLAGIGLANYIETPVGAPLERSQVTVRTDADRVEVVIGTQSGGQGHETSFAQVIESTLGVPSQDVDIVTGDSDIVAEGGGTHSDRSLRLGGYVMVKASEQIIEKGAKIAAHLMEAAAADIRFEAGDRGGRFTVTGTDRSVTLFEAARAAAAGKVPEALCGPLAGDSRFVGRIPAYPNGCAAAEVEIDPDTGVVEIRRYVCIDDVGRVVNPLIVDGQTHGGIAQGVGQVLTEQVVHDAEGQILSGSFMDYGLPRADLLPEFVVENNEVITRGNPLGVKGGGEAGTTGALAVMMNAILDALKPLGITRLDMPATPDRVWRAIHART
ncbi:MAG: xanthine dehydrogenase family protein molybdopterin-binding subunit [Burkholderiales bacterium]|nr:xanthine dehydrogenase family protein molybdopterin-binding subunit [Burkholderiales bacterium]